MRRGSTLRRAANISWKNDTLRGALNRFCELEGLDAESASILLRGNRVQPDTQVRYLEIGVDDILEVASKLDCILLDSSERTHKTVRSNQIQLNATVHAEESTADQILVKLRSADGKTHKYRMRKVIKCANQLCTAECRAETASEGNVKTPRKPWILGCGAQ